MEDKAVYQMDQIRVGMRRRLQGVEIFDRLVIAGRHGKQEPDLCAGGIEHGGQLVDGGLRRRGAEVDRGGSGELLSANTNELLFACPVGAVGAGAVTVICTVL